MMVLSPVFGRYKSEAQKGQVTFSRTQSRCITEPKSYPDKLIPKSVLVFFIDLHQSELQSKIGPKCLTRKLWEKKRTNLQSWVKSHPETKGSRETSFICGGRTALPQSDPIQGRLKNLISAQGTGILMAKQELKTESPFFYEKYPLRQ